MGTDCFLDYRLAISRGELDVNLRNCFWRSSVDHVGAYTVQRRLDCDAMADCAYVLGNTDRVLDYQRPWREAARHAEPGLYLLDRCNCRRCSDCAPGDVQEQKERRICCYTLRRIAKWSVSTPGPALPNTCLPVFGPGGWSFCIGLLQATFILTGYGMVAVMCEEVQNPEREVPRAMVLSVVAAGLTGIVFLIPILFVLPDVQFLLTITSGQPIGFLFREATNSKAAGLALLLLIIGVMFFACIAAMTTASRCAYALSRDKAIPGYQIWKVADGRFEVPLMALLLTVGVVGLMGLIYLGSSAAFNAFTGATTICLSAAFVSPVAIAVIQRRRHLEDSSYPLGRFGWLLNIISIAWVSFAVILFCMPISLPVTVSSMNYTSAVFIGSATISLVWYYVHGREAFSGPPARRVIVIAAREMDAEDGSSIKATTQCVE